MTAVEWIADAVLVVFLIAAFIAATWAPLERHAQMVLSDRARRAARAAAGRPRRT